MFSVRVFPAVAPAEMPAKPKERRFGFKFQLVLDILADLDEREEGLPSGLTPAEVEMKMRPELPGRWAKLRPDDPPKLGRDGKAKLPVSRTVMYRAYQEYFKSR
jgi:hypothetical protein